MYVWVWLASVTELTARIKQTLKTQFDEVALHAEVSNVARPKSGHVYFTLKDDGASIRAVIWRSDARLLAFDLTDGLSVRAMGSLTVYEPRGEYQITVRQIEPEGIGALELAFRQRFAGWPPRDYSTRAGSGRCRGFPAGS